VIKVDQYRYDGNERSVARVGGRVVGTLMGSYETTVGDALSRTAEFELGYGGSVVAVSDTELVFKTCVLSKIDHTVITGPFEELKPFLVFLAIFLQASSEEDYSKLFEALEGTEMSKLLLRPLYLTTAGPMMIGASRVRKGAVGYLSECEEDIALYFEAPMEHLFNLIKLKANGEATTEELRALAA